MSVPLVDSLDEAFGRLFPAKVMNDLFSIENLRRDTKGEGEERRGDEAEKDQVVQRKVEE